MLYVAEALKREPGEASDEAQVANVGSSRF